MKKIESERFFPWADVNASRNDKTLQKKNSVSQGATLRVASRRGDYCSRNHRLANGFFHSKVKTKYSKKAGSCPKCKFLAKKLSWFYFQSPSWTWKEGCGRAGWLVVCDKCNVQVKFFLESMN